MPTRVDSEKPPSLSVQAFWLMAAKTTSFGLSVVLPLLLVRLFNQTEYGIYKQAFTFILTSYSLLNLGMGITAFYFLPRLTKARGQVALNILIFNMSTGSAAFLLLLLYPRVLVHIFGGPELLPYATIIGLIALLAIFSSFLEFIATALQDVAYSAAFIVSAQLSKVAMMTAAALWFRTVEALLYAAVFQGLLQSTILVWYLHRRFGRFWTTFDWRLFREQLSYAIPFGLYGMLSFAQGDIHNYFVANAFGPAAFAIYAVGCLQVPLVTLLRESIAAVLLSKTSELQYQGNSREILLLSARAFRKLALAYLPAYGLFMVAGREFIVLMYTRAYEASWPIFRVNLTMLPLAVLITDHIIRAYAEQRFFIVKVRITLVAIQAAALWIGIRWMGMIGAVVVLVLIALADRVIVCYRTATVVGMRLSDLRLFSGTARIAALSAGCAALTAVAHRLLAGWPPIVVLAACGSIFAALYVAGLFVFRLLDPDERALLHSQLARLAARVRG